MTTLDDEVDGVSLAAAAPLLVHELGNAAQGLQLLDLEDLTSGTRAVLGGVRDRLALLMRQLEQYVHALDEACPVRAEHLVGDARVRLDAWGFEDRVTWGAELGWGAVDGSADALIAALAYLIAYAIRRSAGRDRVRVETWVEPRLVGFRIAATDATGSADDLGAQQTSRRPGETGLEIAIAQRTAVAHGGWVMTTREGAVVTIVLALSRRHRAPDSAH